MVHTDNTLGKTYLRVRVRDKEVDDFEARFPAGVPSLVRCERLIVKGDFRFGYLQLEHSI